MKKTFLIILILLVVGTGIFCWRSILQKSNLFESKVCFKQDCFLVEVVSTSEARAKGLMFRESLPADRGMLFVFQQTGFYPFWMKNTLIPLDMIWLNENYQVAFIASNVQPCYVTPFPNITPLAPARYVLEINAGAVDRLGLEIGDKLTVLSNQVIE